jgi:hypothetical protein
VLLLLLLLLLQATGKRIGTIVKMGGLTASDAW